MCHFVRDRQVTVGGGGGGGIAHSPLPRAKMFSHDKKNQITPFFFGHEKNGSFFFPSEFYSVRYIFFTFKSIYLFPLKMVSRIKKKIPPL